MEKNIKEEKKKINDQGGYYSTRSITNFENKYYGEGQTGVQCGQVTSVENFMSPHSMQR